MTTIAHEKMTKTLVDRLEKIANRCESEDYEISGEAAQAILELSDGAKILIDYFTDHDWGLIPEPYDSINPLLEALTKYARRRD